MDIDKLSWKSRVTIIITAFALTLSVGMALSQGQPADLKLIRTDADITGACSYYEAYASALTLADDLASLKVNRINEVKGEARDIRIEVLTEVQHDYIVRDCYNDCSKTITANGTDSDCVEICEDTPKTETLEKWVSLWDWDVRADKKVSDSLAITENAEKLDSYLTKNSNIMVRICGSYYPMKTADGWGVSIDHIPDFKSQEYPLYDWWNVSFSKRRVINISNTNTTTDMTAGQVVEVIINTSGGDFLENGYDFRVLYTNDSGDNWESLFWYNWTPFDNGQTVFYFKLKDDIPKGTYNDTAYYVYYNYTAAPAPEVDGWNIFSMFDDFATGLNASVWADATDCYWNSEGYVYCDYAQGAGDRDLRTSANIENMTVMLARFEINYTTGTATGPRWYTFGNTGACSESRYGVESDVVGINSVPTGGAYYDFDGSTWYNAKSLRGAANVDNEMWVNYEYVMSNSTSICKQDTGTFGWVTGEDVDHNINVDTVALYSYFYPEPTVTIGDAESGSAFGVSINAPLNQTYQTVPIDINVSTTSDAVACLYNLNGGANSTLSSINASYYYGSMSGLVTGELYTLTVSCNDSGGNWAEDIEYFTFSTVLDIFVYEESNPTTPVNGYSINITSATETHDYVSTSYNYEITVSDLEQGANTIRISNSSYYDRYYYVNITTTYNGSITAYLISTNETLVNPTFIVNNIFDNPVSDVLLTFQKLINESYETVAQRITDDTGYTTVNLISGEDYRIKIAYGSLTQYYSFTAADQQYLITLDEDLEVDFTEPFSEIYVAVSPQTISYNASLSTFNVTFSYTVYSNLSSLTLYGIRLLCDGSQVYESNTTSSGSTGGTLSTSYNVTLCSNMTLEYYFITSEFWGRSITYQIYQNQPYGLYEAVERAKAQFNTTQLSFIAIIILMFVAAGLSWLSAEGGALAGIIMGGIFAWFGILELNLYIITAITLFSIMFIRRRWL